MLNITGQWQNPEILIFCYKSIYYEKIGHMLKPFAPKFRYDIRPFNPRPHLGGGGVDATPQTVFLTARYIFWR